MKTIRINTITITIQQGHILLITITTIIEQQAQ